MNFPCKVVIEMEMGLWSCAIDRRVGQVNINFWHLNEVRDASCIPPFRLYTTNPSELYCLGLPRARVPDKESRPLFCGFLLQCYLAWAHGRKDRRTDGWTDGRTDGRSDGRTDGRTDRRTDGWMDGRMDGWTDGRMDGWTYGQRDRQMDGQIDRWNDGQTDRRIDRQMGG
jgi:hypothetical protein